MEIIKPNLISGEIMEVIEKANSKLILICPYVRISTWFKLKNKIENAKKRKVNIEFYIREGEHESIKEVSLLGITPKEVPNLHCKIYLNEKTAVIASMNLLFSSELSSLDIAYKTSTKEEFQNIFDFYQDYISKIERDKIRIIDSRLKPYEHLQIELKSMLERNYVKISNISFNDNALQVVSETGSYEITITNKYLELLAIVYPGEIETEKRSPSFFSDSNVQISYLHGVKEHAPKIYGRLKNKIESLSLHLLNENDYPLVLRTATQFIYSTENLRDIFRSANDID